MTKRRIISTEIPDGKVFKKMIEFYRNVTVAMSFVFYEDKLQITFGKDKMAVETSFDINNLLTYDTTPSLFNQPNHPTFEKRHVVMVNAAEFHKFTSSIKKETITLMIFEDFPDVLYAYKDNDLSTKVKLAESSQKHIDYVNDDILSSPNCRILQNKFCTSLAGALKMSKKGVNLLVYPRGVKVECQGKGEKGEYSTSWGEINEEQIVCTSGGVRVDIEGDGYSEISLPRELVTGLTKLHNPTSNTVTKIYNEDDSVFIISMTLGQFDQTIIWIVK